MFAITLNNLLVKPRYYRPKQACLVKATQPFKHLSIDFKGPIPSSKNDCTLTIIDEYSRFAFAFPVKDMSSITVIKCLSHLFTMFGMLSYIHSERGPSLISNKLQQWLFATGIANSCTTPYNPTGNGQVERYNGIIWKPVLLALRSRNLPVNSWERVLPDALHSIRSLLCQYQLHST